MSSLASSSAEPSLATVLNTWVEFRIADIHTVSVGEVISFDAAKNMCEVQPSLRQVAVAADGTETPEDVPVLSNVPVLFPRGGGFRITWPLNPGDIVVLVFAERSIDKWAQVGGQVTPIQNRKHDWSDAMAIPVGSVQTNLIPGIGTVFKAGTEDGVTEIVIDPETGSVTINAPQVNLGATGGESVAREGDEVTISPGTAPSFYGVLAALCASAGIVPPFISPITGVISSGSVVVKST